MIITPELKEVMHAYNPRAGGGGVMHAYNSRAGRQTQRSSGACWSVNLAKSSELQVQ